MIENCTRSIILDPKTNTEAAAHDDPQGDGGQKPSVEGVSVHGQEAYRVDDMPENLAAEFEAALRTATYGA